MTVPLSRREFLVSGGALFFKGVAPSTPTIKKTALTISTPKVSTSHKLAFISDIHIGTHTDRSIFNAALDEIVSFAPSTVLLGGDYLLIVDQPLAKITYSAERGERWFEDGVSYDQDREATSRLFEEVSSTIVRKIAPVTKNIFSVLGNHDRWSNYILCKEAWDKQDLNLLINQNSSINNEIVVYGADDFVTGVPKVTVRPPQNKFSIHLTHNPDFYDSLLESGDPIFDLTLMGHTHGGQVVLPLIGAVYSNIQNSALFNGLFVTKRGISFTSQGVGTSGLPFRFNCPPEVVLITVEPGEQLMASVSEV